jgi:hypothetical protein
MRKDWATAYEAVDCGSLMLAKNDLLEFLIFLGEENEILEQAEDVGNFAEGLDLGSRGHSIAATRLTRI